MTNVQPGDLNYDHYEMQKYDNDIVRSIPGHTELHLALGYIIKRDFGKSNGSILELGIGTGLTAEIILQNCYAQKYIGIDFSEQMLQGAKQRLQDKGGDNSIEYIAADYAQINLPQNNDLIVSVIGIHHQETDAEKEELFAKIYNALQPNGAFLFGDLVTFRNKEEAALNEALHFHHLVENAIDDKSLKEWAYHHKFLNKLAALEDQIDWLKEVGFKKVELIYREFNTALIYARK